MNPAQEWQKGRDQFRFRCGDRLHIKETGEIGKVIAAGTDTEGITYMIQIEDSTTWDLIRTVKQSGVESCPHE